MNNSIDESPNLGQENKDLIKQPFYSQNKNFLNHIESSIQQKVSEKNQQFVQQNNLHQNQDIIQKYSSKNEKILVQEDKTAEEEQKINIKKNENSDEQDQQQIYQLGDIQIDIKEGFTHKQQQLPKNVKTPYFQQKGDNIEEQNQQDEYEQQLTEQKVIKENKLYFNLKKLVKNIQLKPGFQKDSYYLNKIKNEQLKNAIEQIQDILKKNTEIYNFNSIYTKDVSLSQNKKNKYEKWDSQYNSEYLEFPNFNEQINTKHIEFKKWWHKKTEQLYKEEHQKSLEIARKKIEDDLNQNNLHIFWSFIKIFLEHKNYRDHDLEKQFKKQNKIPIRTINVKRKLLFPKVIKINDNNFQYKKYHKHEIPTNFPFWRIALFFVRWFCWGFNTFLWLMKQSFIGQFSLKALFTCNKYQRHTTFNYKTGEVSPAYNRQTIRPVCYIFKNVIKGLKRSRKQFEEAPDTGLFPKGFGRICNIFECYIFRLIFVGFFLTLLGMPMLILINFFFSFILGLLALAYMPVAWQIKGPGIGIHKYKQISQNDAQILFKGFLLCKILDIFKSQIRSQIEFHYKQNQDKIQDVVINLNGKYSQECIDKGYFLTFLEKQISFRQKNVYVNPYLGQIRLNKQNLQLSMEQTKVILNNILEPFEEIEARMEVKYLDSNINDQIENALKGKSMLQNNKTSYKYKDKKDIEYEFSMNSPPTLIHIIKNLEQFSLNKNKAYGYDYNKIDPMIVTDYIQFYQDSRGFEIM
ncbi:hypothetical protein PPERSA_04725 [Pseudocohnilembus persalinus]|uniref:Transmembrane protein n=1 Tax=Pseudocohnilembus persalinus TaxID=266149 RepID=A0A0V0R4K7_PSEPJ|nr:hypothetical protein PPERSA_04725 [Pseudocohnilembus persalinus]|eukprot:KRX09419.1 hypothetical protein PPERSA_04725 [Pseudocohnilembus persalinus]